jgi:sugar O-acyltransferase (sialic acid O-acetyltransferase NeuD family)
MFAGYGGHSSEIKAFYCKISNKSIVHFVTSEKYSENDKSCIYLEEDVKFLFDINSNFILATGGSKLRYKFYNKLTSLGGIATSAVSETSIINTKESNLGCGLNIMDFVYLGPNSSVGTGSLLNTSCSIHHDAKIGKFVEIAPGARILGSAKIGNQCLIGTNSVIFPNVSIGDNCKIGAGVVVKKDIPADSIIKS